MVEKFELSRKANHHRTRKNLGTAQIKQISNLIEASAEQLPFECKCFPRAITGKWLLSKQGIKTNLKLGLAKGLKPEKPLLAHAWLVHKGEIIIGRSKTEFCEVGNF